jgi:flagellar FliJ protein
MAFKFPLAAVLKYREEIEKREERALECRREIVVGLEARLAEVRSDRSRTLLDREVSLKRGALGDDLHYLIEQQQYLEKLEQQLRREVAAALVEFDKQMKVFMAARQKREILDELKIAQKDKYEEKQERREQMLIDEMFSARLHRDT